MSNKEKSFKKGFDFSEQLRSDVIGAVNKITAPMHHEPEDVSGVIVNVALKDGSAINILQSPDEVMLSLASDILQQVYATSIDKTVPFNQFAHSFAQEMSDMRDAGNVHNAPTEDAQRKS